MSDLKVQMLFRGGPLDGFNCAWNHGENPPEVLKGFLTNSPADVTIPPVESGALLEYHRQDLFICDVAPEVRAVIYVWNRT